MDIGYGAKLLATTGKVIVGTGIVNKIIKWAQYANGDQKIAHVCGYLTTNNIFAAPPGM